MRDPLLCLPLPPTQAAQTSAPEWSLKLEHLSCLCSTSTYAAGMGPDMGTPQRMRPAGPALQEFLVHRGTAKAKGHSVQSGQCRHRGCRGEGPCPVRGWDHPWFPRDLIAEQGSARLEGAGDLGTIHSFIQMFIHSFIHLFIHSALI